MVKPTLAVEVVFAAPDKQWLISLEVPAGTCARAAVLLSGLAAEVADLDLAQAPLGIFGESLSDPEHYVLQAGERVEIYRALLRDPKARRRDKAARLR